MSVLVDLVESVRTLSELESKTVLARKERDRLVREYLADGATVYTTAKLLGVSRQAVMKIRDARA